MRTKRTAIAERSMKVINTNLEKEQMQQKLDSRSMGSERK